MKTFLLLGGLGFIAYMLLSSKAAKPKARIWNHSLHRWECIPTGDDEREEEF